jgi:hypothetical protein
MSDDLSHIIRNLDSRIKAIETRSGVKGGLSARGAQWRGRSGRLPSDYLTDLFEASRDERIREANGSRYGWQLDDYDGVGYRLEGVGRINKKRFSIEIEICFGNSYCVELTEEVPYTDDYMAEPDRCSFTSRHIGEVQEWLSNYFRPKM